MPVGMPILAKAKKYFMRKVLWIGLVIVSSFIGAILGILFALQYLQPAPPYPSIEQRQKNMMVNAPRDSSFSPFVSSPNFQPAAKAVTPAVVHIRTTYGSGSFSINALEHYFNPHAQSSGSGVIVTDDGYIVTNYHVIENATNIEVVLHTNERYFAKLVGKDPSTDLALLKIKASRLPFVPYGDSDLTTAGEWVLAIGNPFDLNSTITAGIVSAKARNIGILRDRNSLQVESFIQTDAAVNPGNSGGALVNLKGELIGINSAIATNTGSYSGYSFAIPVNLVKKIMDDLLEFGEVQRGLLGVQINDVTAELSEELGLDIVRGVFVSSVNEGSAAEQAGIQQGDVIIAINKHEVNSVSELQERVARNRPGHSVLVSYRRGGSNREVLAQLKNYAGEITIQKKKMENEIEGASFEEIDYPELAALELEGGIKITSLTDGKWKKAGIQKGFVMTHIDKVSVSDITSLNQILEIKKGGMLVEGVYRDGTKGTYGVDW
jgi:Do/DeqQ family serine protease